MSFKNCYQTLFQLSKRVVSYKAPPGGLSGRLGPPTGTLLSRLRQAVIDARKVSYFFCCPFLGHAVYTEYGGRSLLGLFWLRILFTSCF